VLEASDARKLKALEDENAKLKKLLVEAMLDNAILKDVVAKNDDARPRGGWPTTFLDDGLNRAISETIAGDFDMLLGFRTYEISLPPTGRPGRQPDR
jgi:hypothetical protein